MSKYISLENLTRYDSKIQEYLASFCASRQDGMWRQTEKAGAVSFWPVGNSPLEGTVEFKFKETGPASGTKSPDNPSTISGVSSVTITRCGKNLISTPYYHASGREHLGITYTLNSDGSLVCNGTSEGYASFICAYNKFLPVGTYTLSGCPSGGNSSTTYSLAIQRFSGATYQDYGNGVTFEVQEPGFYYISAVVKPGYVANNLVFSPPQLELGSAVTAFEPYSGNDFTLSLGGTYYGGSIDLATGLMTVTWAGSILTGTESNMRSYGTIDTDLRYTFNFTSHGMPKPKGKPGTAFCSHSASFYEGNSSIYGNFYVRKIQDIGYFCLHDKYGTKWSSYEVFASWVAEQYSAGTPVVFVYEIDTPQTVQLSPLTLRSLVQPDKYVPRLNTVYSDAENVQIVYQKNPVRDKFEKVSAIVAQGGNV